MSRPAAVITGVVMLAAVLVMFIPSTYVSADTVKIHYQESPDIQVVFPQGDTVEKGGEVTVIVSSNRYDMIKSGIMLYEVGSDGKTDYANPIEVPLRSTPDGNTVTHTFSNLNKNAEMAFFSLTELETKDPAEEGSEPATDTETEGKESTFSIDAAMLITIASIILATVMLILMAAVNKTIDSVIKSEGELQ
jgi:hypothetical protein